MATTIRDFYAQATGRGFSRDFHFRVLGMQLAGGVNFSAKEDLVFARSASLPARAIENKIANFYGQQFNIPGKAAYPSAEAYTIEFYHDEECDLRTQFERASRLVFDDYESGGEYGVPGDESIINLQVIDKKLNPVKNIELVGASIREVGEVSYQIADGTGEVTVFPVTFSYHWYTDFSNTNGDPRAGGLNN